MGNVLSTIGDGLSLSLGFTRLSVTWRFKKHEMCGKPFVEMIKGHYAYGRLINRPTVYQLRLVHKPPKLHWYLLIKQKDSPLPYVTVEITTSDLRDLIPCIRTFESCDDDASDVGIYEGKLIDLCKLADETVEEMGTYNLLTRNCQHFCNRLLKKLYKEEFPYTYESNIADTKFDYHSQVLPEVQFPVDYKNESEHPVGETYEFVKRVTWKAETVDQKPELKLSTPAPPPTINDLGSLVDILTPIQNKWRDLGGKLAINPLTLDKIAKNYRHIAHQCLREMLREYLQHPYPPPSWVKLANHVQVYDPAVAFNVIKNAERIATSSC